MNCPSCIRFWSYPALVLGACLAGCVLPQSRLTVIDFNDDGTSNHYAEDFDEAYYDIDDSGNVDLILRRAQSGRMSNELDLTQIVHVQSVWKSIPGQTIAHDDQINATITYAILGTAAGHTFEGAGSVFFKRSRDDLTGQIGRVVLNPSRSVVPTKPLFNRAELSGSFRAAHDPQQVKRIKNELRRIFGPRPIG